MARRCYVNNSIESSLFLLVIVILGLLLGSRTCSSVSLGSPLSLQVHIVYLGENGGVHPDLIRDTHHRILASVKGSMEAAIDSILYSYKHSFSGFSARLSKEEASNLSRIPEVISVFQSKEKTLHTTHSWDFLGVDKQERERNVLYKTNRTSQSLWERARYGQDIIVGLLDTGVWPESESFRDDGMTPVPESWRGVCVAGDFFNSSHCNRKLIGARVYLKGYESIYGALNVSATGEFRSPRDKDGHGTHTASTAGGRRVAEAAALGGYALGEASGGASMARIAMYKVCWPIPGTSPVSVDTCTEADMLAAFDDALADGVHILSVSIGYSGLQPAYSDDSIAIGALHAVQKGVLVVCSAGNDGPTIASVTNLAPWILTVAASSLDRTFPSQIVLGNGIVLEGQTVTPYSLSDKFYPFILGRDALISSSAPASDISASECLPGTLDTTKAKGKIILCLRGGGMRLDKAAEAMRAGAAGLILANTPINGSEVAVDTFLLPGTAVVANVTERLLGYLNNTASAPSLAKLVNPVKTLLGVKPSPFVAAFSSQGPNPLNPDIIKPDISAPGLNILAAWTLANSPTKLPKDNRRVKFNIISGTSMACPHVSGSAALIKSIHPDWSPAAIKSALMTTATNLNNAGDPIANATGFPTTPFNLGSGEVNPSAAADPGLVYDLGFEDYMLFLCAAGYNESTIKKVAGSKFTCTKGAPLMSDLNYPSVAVKAVGEASRVVRRTVTNVGEEGDVVYKVKVEAIEGFDVAIYPAELVFKRTGEKKSFNIYIDKKEHNLIANGTYLFGSFTWTNGVHSVRSPMVILADSQP